MTPLPEGRLLCFADLRPDHVGRTRDDAGMERTLVALAILEYPSVQWEVDPDQVDVLVEQITTLQPGEAADETETALGLGEGTLGFGYSVLELDSQGEVIDDWMPGDLAACMAFLGTYKGAAWESLPSDRERAASLVRHRLAEPPGLA